MIFMRHTSSQPGLRLRMAFFERFIRKHKATASQPGLECPDSSAADRRDVSRRSGIDNGQWTMDNGQLKRHAECPDSSAADRRDVSRRSGIVNCLTTFVPCNSITSVR
jgi:hypothetical protein